MFPKTLTSLLIASLVTPLIAIGAQAADIPDFKRVTRSLAIGGPPTDEGIQLLFGDHFGTVIDLRPTSERTAQEGARVERMGNVSRQYAFKYVNIPIDGVPTQNQLGKFLSTLDVTPADKTDWIPNFYMHSGKDVSLAAAMAGIWRIYKDDWDYDKVWQEMVVDGFNVNSPKANDLIDFVKRYAEQHKS